MSTDVVMPQMGESITEGTIVKWIKKVGDRVERDEPIFEISTDKVDAEIPSPAAGVLTEILFGEGETVEVNRVVARIGEAGAQPVAAPVAVAPPPVVAAPPPVAVAPPPPPPPVAVAPPPPPPPVVDAAPAPPAASVGGTDVVMPQMGESITEGTIVKWLKVVGDKVERDEPIFEISTDKVDAEIPSPTSGVLLEILVNAGETVPINTVVARVGGASAAAPTPQPVAVPAPAPPPVVVEAPPPAPAPATKPLSMPVPPPPPASMAAAVEGRIPSPEELRQKRSSPLVRKIARENNLNILEIQGTGLSGRVTKNDVLGYLDRRAEAPAPPPAVAAPVAPVAVPTPPPTPRPAPAVVSAPPAPAPKPAPAYAPGDRVEIVPMTPMRQKIAERMVASKHTSAHVNTIFEIDMTNVVNLRERNKKVFEQRHGTKLTLTTFIIKAVIEALKVFPIVNASVEGSNIVYKKDINIGVAVALDWGLIVPVIKNADEKNMLGLSRTLNDMAGRARAKQLKPDEVGGGTFTITNPGIYGSLFGTPVINQPQVAILGVGTVEKRLKVMADDSIAIRSMAYFSLSFDHRIIDGAVADQFMGHFKKVLEGFHTDELE